jgi:hypothetical protein
MVEIQQILAFVALASVSSVNFVTAGCRMVARRASLSTVG